MRGGVPRLHHGRLHRDGFRKRIVPEAIYIARRRSRQHPLHRHRRRPTGNCSIFQKYDWPLDIRVRTIGEEYNANVLERELLASRYRLEGFQLADIQRLAQTRFVDDNNQDYLTEVTNEIMGLGPYFRAVLDNLDFFLQRDDPARVISMVRMLQAHAQMVRGLLMISVSSDGLDPAIKQELSSIADMVLSFKVRTIGTDFENSMIVSSSATPLKTSRSLSSELRPKKESRLKPWNVSLDTLLWTKRHVQNGRALASHHGQVPRCYRGVRCIGH